jgi:site-specific DNA-methyltransferase (adenine-specific)
MTKTNLPVPLRTLGHDDWVTPPSVFDPVNAAFQFDLDVCATDARVSKCDRFLSPTTDALQVNWGEYGTRAWCNPPYGRELPKWFESAAQAMQNGLDVCVMLVMANTETIYWQRYVKGTASEVVFLAPRIRFQRPDGALVSSSAPKGSALVVYDRWSSNQTVHSYWSYLFESFDRRSP